MDKPGIYVSYRELLIALIVGTAFARALHRSDEVVSGLALAGLVVVVSALLKAFRKPRGK